VVSLPAFTSTTFPSTSLSASTKRFDFPGWPGRLIVREGPHCEECQPCTGEVQHGRAGLGDQEALLQVVDIDG
jgi:hypothetical protein